MGGNPPGLPPLAQDHSDLCWRFPRSHFCWAISCLPARGAAVGSPEKSKLAPAWKPASAARPGPHGTAQPSTAWNCCSPSPLRAVGEGTPRPNAPPCGSLPSGGPGCAGGSKFGTSNSTRRKSCCRWKSYPSSPLTAPPSGPGSRTAGRDHRATTSHHSVGSASSRHLRLPRLPQPWQLHPRPHHRSRPAGCV